MRIICFFFTILIAATATAAGLQQLIDSIKKPPASQPAPQASKPPQPIKK